MAIVSMVAPNSGIDLINVKVFPPFLLTSSLLCDKTYISPFLSQVNIFTWVFPVSVEYKLYAGMFTILNFFKKDFDLNNFPESNFIYISLKKDVAPMPHPFLFSAHDLSLSYYFSSNLNITKTW